MMSLRASSYAKILLSLGIPEGKVKEALLLIKENDILKQALNNPAIQKHEKEAVVDKLFDVQMRNFIKVLCVEKCIDLVDEILEEYETVFLASKDIVKAKLSFVTKFEAEELEQMKDMICKKYNKAGVEFELIEDPSLIGGFCLTIGNTEYDRSIRACLKELNKTLAGR